MVKKTEIIIKCKNYELILNNNELSALTKTILNTINDSYLFIINTFEENNVSIKSIISGKRITLILKIYILNKQRDIEMILSHNKRNKDLFINELNNNCNEMKKYIENLNNEIIFLKNEIYNLKMLTMYKNNENMGGANMNMMNQMGGANINMMNQMGGANMNMINQMGGMDMNMINQMGGMDMNMMNQMGGMDMNMMNQMGGMDMNMINQMGSDNDKWALIFENQDDKKTYYIKISKYKTVQEAFNKYKIKSGRMGKMKFIFNKELYPELKICFSELSNLSKILVINLDDNKEWNLIFENLDDRKKYNIRISEQKTIKEAINLYKIKSGRWGKKFIFNNKELLPEMKICQSELNNFSRILVYY